MEREDRERVERERRERGRERERANGQTRTCQAVGHRQKKPLNWSMQVPPFLHGELRHSLVVNNCPTDGGTVNVDVVEVQQMAALIP